MSASMFFVHTISGGTAPIVISLTSSNAIAYQLTTILAVNATNIANFGSAIAIQSPVYRRSERRAIRQNRAQEVPNYDD